MVLRNRRGKNTKRSCSGLEPCRRPVDAREAKAALKAFLAACGKAAAVTTIALAVGGTNVGCESEPEPRGEIMSTGGIVAPTEIATQPAGKGSGGDIPMLWHSGVPPISEITELPLEQEPEPEPSYTLREPPPKIRLVRIVHRGKGFAAYINGRYLSVGDKIMGARIIAIDRFSVEMEMDGENGRERFTLRLAGSGKNGESAPVPETKPADEDDPPLRWLLGDSPAAEISLYRPDPRTEIRTPLGMPPLYEIFDEPEREEEPPITYILETPEQPR